MSTIWLVRDKETKESNAIITTNKNTGTSTSSEADNNQDEGELEDYDICRVCLNKESLMLPIFTTKAPLFYNMINFCTTLQVQKDDEFPDKICQNCSKNLETSFKFKRLAEKSNDILMNRLFLRKVKNEKKILSETRFTKISVTPVKIEFNSIEDIKSKLKDKENILIKKEKVDSKEEMDSINVDMPLGHDVVICNTVIRKVDKDDMPLSSLCSETKKEKYSDDDCFENTEEVFISNDYNEDCDDEEIKIKKYNVPAKKKIKKLKKSKKHKYKYKNIRVIRKVKEMPENYGEPTDDSLKLKGPINLIKPIPVSDRGDPLIQELTKSLESKFEPNDPKKFKGKTSFDAPLKIRKIIKEKEHKSKGPREKHVCPVCGILTYSLGSHLLIHQERKPYSCEQCKKSFVQKVNYDMHMKKHTGIKDQICEVCGASFFYIKSVLRHKLIHQGIRNFACTLCPKTFIAKCDLNRHLKVHAGYKPYKCIECTMSFNAKHQLITHIRMHTGEKPYTCEICKLSFTYKVNLNNHVFKVHGVNLKFKSIYTVTAEVLNREYQLDNNTANNSTKILHT